MLLARSSDLDSPKGHASRQGRFRKYLNYRLNVVPVRMPTLIERREDISELVCGRHRIDGVRPDDSKIRYSPSHLLAAMEQ